MENINNKYILFGDGKGWFGKLFEEIKGDINVSIGEDNFAPYKTNIFFHYLCYILLSSRFRFLPGKNVLSYIIIKYLVCKIRQINKGYAICIFNQSNKLSHNKLFLSCIKEKCKNYKLVYWFTDVVSAVERIKPDILELCDDYYDYVITYDRIDAEKYNFKYIETPYGFPPLTSPSPAKDIDLLYVGKAKLELDPDRFKKIIYIYEKALRKKLTVEFYIVGVPAYMQCYQDSIVYNKYISYDEILEKVKRSKCILEVSQRDERGTTLRLYESIAFNTHLLFTNKHLLTHPYYNEESMHYIECDDDETIDFGFLNRKVVTQEEQIKKLSPAHFLNEVYHMVSQVNPLNNEIICEEETK